MSNTLSNKHTEVLRYFRHCAKNSKSKELLISQVKQAHKYLNSATESQKRGKQCGLIKKDCSEKSELGCSSESWLSRSVVSDSAAP